MQLYLLNDEHLHKCTLHAHFMCMTWGSIILCAAVMLYVLFPTFLPKLSDQDGLSAPGFSVRYEITGSQIK